MKTHLILRKLYREEKEFVKSETIKGYCDLVNIDYDTAMRHLIPRGYLVRIFKGIFYIKSPEEKELGRMRYNPLKLVSKGLELKGVENWYFGHYSGRYYDSCHKSNFYIPG